MKLEIVETVDSTSAALKRRLAARPEDEVALLARQQTAGRGRLGRVWESPKGNLYFSILVRPVRMRAPGHWSILSAVVLAEAVAACLPEPAKLRLKWPNDLLLGGGKLAGILLETGADGAPWLLIGYGVNLVTAPEGLERSATALVRFAPAPEPEVLAQDVLARLAAWRTRYAEDGFEPVRSAWLERGPEEGERVAATLGDRRVEGSFAGIAASGGLRLDTPSGPRTIIAGELY